MLELSELRLFNRGLITTMEPTQHPDQILNTRTPSGRMELKLMQYVDALKAYLHVERTILNDKFTTLNPAILLQWIKEIHQLMAATVLSPYQIPPGEYSKQTMMEWLIEPEIHEALIDYLSSEALESNVHDDHFVALCLEEIPDIDPKKLKIFLELIRWANENTEIILSDSNRNAALEASDAEGKKILPALFKLQALDLEGKLLPEQRSVLHGIITFHTPMEQIPGAMEKYATNVVSKFNACASNPQNLQAISQFVAEVYDEFIKIHPFPYCNDQMALCLLNLFLVALDHPSILLCHPGDVENDDSLYTRAMDDLDETTESLRELISCRIIEATYIGQFTNSEIEENIRNKFTILENLKAMEKSDGQIVRPRASPCGAFDATCNDEIQYEIAAELARITGGDPWELVSNPLTFDDFLGDNLANQPPPLPHHGANPNGFYAVQPAAFSEKKIASRLERVSGVGGWIVDRVRLTARCDAPYCKERVDEIMARLKQYQIARNVKILAIDTESEKQIVSRLTRISGLDGWIVNPVELSVTCVLPIFSVKEPIAYIKDRLEQYRIAKKVDLLTINPENGWDRFVIQCTDINLEQLTEACPRSCVIDCTGIDLERLDIAINLLKQKNDPGVSGAAKF